MTSITVTVPDELAETARIQGLLDPQRLATVVCEALTRVTTTNKTVEEEFAPTPDDCRLLYEDLMALAGSAGPELPRDFADNHDHYIHGTPKK